MRWMIRLFLAAGLAAGLAETTAAQNLVLDAVSVIDAERGEGGARHATKTLFRDSDVMIQGAGPGYGFITVIPYAGVKSIVVEHAAGVPTASDVLKAGVDATAVPPGETENAWFAVVYTDSKGTERTALLHVGPSEDLMFLTALLSLTGAPVTRFDDGRPGAGLMAPGSSPFDVVRASGEPDAVFQFGDKLILGYGAASLGVNVKFVFVAGKLVDVE